MTAVVDTAAALWCMACWVPFLVDLRRALRRRGEL